MTNIFIVTAFFFYTCSAGHVEDKYYPWYHLAPPSGWMNDPNGFCHDENGVIHLFYQYNPYNSTVPGTAHWGHATSKNFVYWKHEPIALYPNNTYDSDGVFSGSAIVEDGEIYIFYTGNVNHPNENPDHEQHQALATLSAGNNGVATKYPGNPIIIGKEHQPNFRDPKVWKHCNKYYMVLGNSFNNNSLGRALLYASEDKITWKQVSVLDESDGSLGYMWECPDFFELNGTYVLLMSPQGIKPVGDRYRNLYQTGYILGTFDYNNYTFKRIKNFTELDSGHDFYATQSMLIGIRRIVIAWLDMWQQNYPEGVTGFTGCMTIARELTLGKNGMILQRPVQEINIAIGENLFSGEAKPGTEVELKDNTAEIIVKASKFYNFELRLESEIYLVVLSYDCINGTVTLDRGGNDGVRRTAWKPSGHHLKWRLFVDRSSVELFCGEGEVTFTSRIFPNDTLKAKLGKDVVVDEFKVNSMKRTVPKP